MTILLHSIGFGLVTAAIVALAAVSFSLQFGVTTTPNFAHGDLLTVGAYGGYLGEQVTGSALGAAVGALLGGALAAVILNLALVQPFVRRRAKRVTIFLVTVAFSICVENLILIFFGGAPLPYRVLTPGALHSVGPFQWTSLDFLVMGTAAAILVCLHVLLQYTKLGKAMRAVSDNPDLARVTGIRTSRVINLTWLLDGLIAGYAGFVLAAYVGSMSPTLGFDYLVVIFAAAVVGGLGKPRGALVGAVIIGVAMEVSGAYLPPAYSMSIAFVILVGALLIRPRGIISAPVWDLSQ